MSKVHFEKMKETLEELGIPFEDLSNNTSTCLMITTDNRGSLFMYFTKEGNFHYTCSYGE